MQRSVGLIRWGYKKECLKVHVTGTTVYTLGFKLILWKGLDISVNRVLIQHSIQVWLNSALIYLLFIYFMSSSNENAVFSWKQYKLHWMLCNQFSCVADSLLHSYHQLVKAKRQDLQFEFQHMCTESSNSNWTKAIKLHLKSIFNLNKYKN